MSSNSAQGISLWLEPEGPSRARFTALIQRLSADLGTTPFEPHLTLLGGLEGAEEPLLETAGGLAAKLAPVEIRLTRAGVGRGYFHFLFFEVALTRELVAAHATACRAFAREPGGFGPHLSLAYAIPGEHDPDQLLKSVPGRPWGRFRVETLTVVRTDGPPADWRVLARLPLKG